MTNNHSFVVETALDSLAENLNIDCSWIQVTSPFSQYPHLASFRNFTDEIHHEMSRIDLNNYFIEEVVGLGNKIVVPSLNMQDAHILAIFRKAGFRSLISVPITTYRVLGIMGVAYRKKRTFSKDYINLIVLISNLVGMALSKNMMIEHTIRQDYRQQRDSLPEIPEQQESLKGKRVFVTEETEILKENRVSVIEETEILEDNRVPVIEETEVLEDNRVPIIGDKVVIDHGTGTEGSEETYQKHTRIMADFRKSHSNRLP